MVMFLVGESRSGKSTLARALSEKYEYKVVKSYTTRPKRINEESNADHIFISDEEYDRLWNPKRVVAHTLFNGYRYMATVEQVMFSDIYIIDPAGLQRLMNIDDIDYFIVYLETPELTRFARMLRRGDTEEEANSRLYHDKIAFEEWHKSAPRAYVTIDGTKDIDELVEDVHELFELRKELKNEVD